MGTTPVLRKILRCSSVFLLLVGLEILVPWGTTKIGGAVPPGGGFSLRLSACILKVDLMIVFDV